MITVLRRVNYPNGYSSEVLVQGGSGVRGRVLGVAGVPESTGVRRLRALESCNQNQEGSQGASSGLRATSWRAPERDGLSYVRQPSLLQPLSPIRRVTEEQRSGSRGAREEWLVLWGTGEQEHGPRESKRQNQSDRGFRKGDPETVCQGRYLSTEVIGDVSGRADSDQFYRQTRDMETRRLNVIVG